MLCVFYVICDIVIPPLIPLEDLLTQEAFKKGPNLCPYVGKGWVQTMVKRIQENLPKEEDQLLRKSPIAFVSCARGGKTRALLELTEALRKEGIVAVNVSFDTNDFLLPPYQRMPAYPSYLRDELLRRITFVLQKKEQEIKFSNCGVNEAIPGQLQTFPGNIVLLIDELNNVIPQIPSTAVPDTFIIQQEELWSFIKSYFLVKSLVSVFFP